MCSILGSVSSAMGVPLVAKVIFNLYLQGPEFDVFPNAVRSSKQEAHGLSCGVGRSQVALPRRALPLCVAYAILG